MNLCICTVVTICTMVEVARYVRAYNKIIIITVALLVSLILFHLACTAAAACCRHL